MGEGEPINMNESVLCLKAVATKNGSATNLKTHLKRTRPIQLERGYCDSCPLRTPLPDSANVDEAAPNGTCSPMP